MVFSTLLYGSPLLGDSASDAGPLDPVGLIGGGSHIWHAYTNDTITELIRTYLLLMHSHGVARIQCTGIYTRTCHVVRGIKYVDFDKIASSFVGRRELVQ